VRSLFRFALVAIACLVLGTADTLAQAGPEGGGNELQVWTGGGMG